MVLMSPPSCEAYSSGIFCEKLVKMAFLQKLDSNKAMFIYHKNVFSVIITRKIQTIFFYCPFTQDIILYLKDNFGWVGVPQNADFDDFIDKLNHVKHNPPLNNCMLFSIAWWLIWFHRNKVIFRLN